MTTGKKRKSGRGVRASPRRTRSTRSVRGATARPGRRVRAFAAPAAALSEQVANERERARVAIVDAMTDLTKRMGNTVDPDELDKLTVPVKQLADKQVELMAIELQELLDSEPVRNALASLRSTTDRLERAVQEMKKAVQAIRKATQILGFVDEILASVGILRGA